MKFKQALYAMKQGYHIKLPSWCGYWAWENDTIMMHTKDNQVIDMFATERKEYTLDNVASDEWIFADEENTPILGGTARMSFGDALKLAKRGMGMRLPEWPDYKAIYIKCGKFRLYGRKNKWHYVGLTESELLSEDWEVIDQRD